MHSVAVLRPAFATALLAAVLAQGVCTQAAQNPAASARAGAESQPLAELLAEFAQKSGLQLIYVSTLAADKRAHAAADGLPPAQELAEILEGSGLTFTFLNSRTVKIYAAPILAEHKPAASSVPREEHKAAAAAELDEVLVTATKRPQRLAELPMSANVLSGEEMYAAGIEGISEIAAVTPGIEYDFSSQFGPGILTNIAIRGISADKGDATTGIYIDDTPIQAPHTSFGDPFPVTFDLSRVEVLRGPQGTLFGSGAEGGAIRFITNEPSLTNFDALYRAQMSVTQQGGTNYEAGAAVGGPLQAGVVGARLSAWYRTDAGYVNRVDPFTGVVVDGDANHSWAEALRVALAIEPAEGLRITPALSYQAQHLHDSPVFYGYLSDPEAGNFNSGRLLRQPDDDGFTLASLKIEQHLAGTLLTAITSYFDRSASALVDETNEVGVVDFNGYGNPLGAEYPSSYADAVPSQLSLSQIQWTQELRLATQEPEAPFSWVAGVFYSRLRLEAFQYEYQVAAPLPPASTGRNYSVDTEVSGYGQATWRFLPTWSVGAGMRVGWQQGQNTAVSGGFPNGGASPPSYTNRNSNLPPTPRFDLSYQPHDGQLYYVAVAEGFRHGGTNGNQPPVCNHVADPDIYAPDTDWSFEVGSKNQFFNRRLQLNASVYDIAWRGIQEGTNDACLNTYTANVGAANSAGFDVKAEALLGDHLSLALSVGYIDVQYTRTLIVPGGTVIADRGAVVGGVPSVPAPWSGTVTLKYEKALSAETTGYVRIDDTIHSHNPGPFTERDQLYVYHDPRYTADPALDLLNPQLGLKWTALDVKVFATNALNQHPELQLFADAPGSSLLYAYTLQPRTIGLAASWAY